MASAKKEKMLAGGFRAMLLALGAALCVGGLLRFVLGEGAATVARDYILSPGKTMYLAALKLVVGPVVFFMIASSVAGVSDYKAYGRIGGKVLGLYMTTSVLAIGLGMGTALLLHPGRGVTLPAGAAYGAQSLELSLVDTVVGIVPDNLLRPFLEADMIQILFLALLLGGAAGLLERRKGLGQLRRGLELLKEWFLMAASLVLKLIPAGMFFAVALLVLEIDGATLWSLLKLVGCVFLGSAGMMGLYGLMFFAATGKSPGRLMKKCLPNLTAFALLCSTSAVMPQSLEACEKKLGIDPVLSSFSMPLGSTVNMDGACVYLTVSALFLAEVYGVRLTPAMLVQLGLTTLLLSVGAPPIPGAGFICLSVLVSQLGIPMESIGFLLGIDQLMSSLRTVVNGAGDFVATAIVAHSEGRMDEGVFDQ